MKTIRLRDFYTLPKEFQKAIQFCATAADDGLAPAQIIQDLSEYLTKHLSVPQENASTVATSVYNKYEEYKEQGVVCNSFGKALISTSDLCFLKAETPFGLATEDPKIRKLVLAFLFYYHEHYHDSGWVRYDKKEIFILAGLNKLPVKEQEQLTNYIHKEYGLNMRVVGSNQPIPCFSLEWAKPSPDNILEEIGELSVEFIEEYERYI